MIKLKKAILELLEDYVYWERKFRNPEKTIKKKFKDNMGYNLDLDNPITFNEKLQWLKLNDNNSLYTKLVDKYEVREYISNEIGKEYLIPLIGVYDTFEEIDFDKLPNKFVLKCTHDSGGVLICKDKKLFDKKNARKFFNKRLKRNFYYAGFEYPYKNIKPRIICEEYMVDESGYELKDYKFFCFDGEVKALFLATDRPRNTKFDFYDRNFNRINVKQYYENSDKEHVKPQGFEKMIKLSEMLSKEIPHVRIDFYNINGKIYFGEMTFYHFCGYKPFTPNEYDYIFGKWINISKI